jgi:predicted metal-dependent HD superfamily phosphohydrolase
VKHFNHARNKEIIDSLLAKISELEEKGNKHIEICERHVSTRRYLEKRIAVLEKALTKVCDHVYDMNDLEQESQKMADAGQDLLEMTQGFRELIGGAE